MPHRSADPPTPGEGVANLTRHSAGTRAVSPDEAWGHLRGLIPRCKAESVSLKRSLGRVLGQDVVCGKDIPPHDVALVDGYALRVEDLSEGKPLRVLGEVGAGGTWPNELTHGQTVRVMTGARIPRGTQLVLPLEEIKGGGRDWITGPREGHLGAHILRQGDVAVGGQCLICRGERVGPRELSILAANALARVRVVRRPRVRILPTGSELTAVGEAGGEGKVPASHGWYLKASIESAGATAILQDPIPDDPEVLGEAVARDRGEQCLITIGGTGRGTLDLVDPVTTGLGATTLFRGIRMRPGGTMALYALGPRPVLALPGGWGGVRLGFHLLICPAVKAMLGERPLGDRLQCHTADDLSRIPEAYRFLEARIWVDGGRLWTSVVPRGPRGGGFPSRRGQGWIEVEPGAGSIPRGSVVWVHPESGALDLETIRSQGEWSPG